MRLLLNSIRAEPSEPDEKSAKYGFPRDMRATRVKRSGEVDASSEMASKSQEPRMMVLNAKD